MLCIFILSIFQTFRAKEHEVGSVHISENDQSMQFSEKTDSLQHRLFRMTNVEKELNSSVVKYRLFRMTNVEKELNSSVVQENVKNQCAGYTKPLEKLQQWSSQQRPVYTNVILIVVAFKTEFEDIFKLHDLMYRHTFPKMVFCGPTKKSTLDYTFPFVFFRQHTYDAELFYTCVDEVMTVYPDADGYLLISDDVLFFHWNTEFSKESLAKIWFREDTEPAIYDLTTNCHSEWKLKSPSNCKKASWTPITKEQVRNGAITALSQLRDSNLPVLSNCFKTLAVKNGGEFRINYQWRIADIFYIPATVTKEFQLISRVFARNSLIHALAIPTISKCLEDKTGFYPLPGINDLKSRPALGKSPWIIIDAAINSHMTHVHPYKLSSVQSNSKLELRKYFCDSLLPMFLSH